MITEPSSFLKNELRWFQGQLQLSPKYFTNFQHWTVFTWAKEIDKNQKEIHNRFGYEMTRVLSDEEFSQQDFSDKLNYSDGWFVYSYLLRSQKESWFIAKSYPTGVPL